MKPVAAIIIILSLTIVAYKLGHHYGQAAGNATAASYQELYNQAILWQHINCNDIPKLSPNIKLKEKQP